MRFKKHILKVKFSYNCVGTPMVMVSFYLGNSTSWYEVRLRGVSGKKQGEGKILPNEGSLIRPQSI